MSPGILQDTSLLELHSDTVLRARWEARDVDHKAVGGHLPLSKRNSTPVGAMTPSSAHVSLLQAQVNAKAMQQQLETPNLHRRLDRSHSEPVTKGGDSRQANSSRYKTELCRPFEENGFCKYGDKCQFAHGHPELRTLTRHPKYKTELCRTFHTIGFCPYGPRCHFIHNAEERRGASGGSINPQITLSACPATKKLLQQQMSGLGLGMGSTAESPSPPSSLHGSPTQSAGSFFDDTFSLFPGYPAATAQGILENLSLGMFSNGFEGGPGSPNGSSCSAQLANDYDLVREGTLLMAGLETPPVSPVESLAGDLDSLSISSNSHPSSSHSSSHSSSPTPAMTALDISRSLRLPIFEQLCEQD